MIHGEAIVCMYTCTIENRALYITGYSQAVIRFLCITQVTYVYHLEMQYFKTAHMYQT